MHTKDKLAAELRKIGLNAMAKRAEEGYYHDFLSPLPMPELELINDLALACSDQRSREHKIAILDLRERVMAGEFDASPDESDDWAKSAEGQEAFRLLLGGRKFDGG
jgi:hypothetical protein